MKKIEAPASIEMVVKVLHLFISQTIIMRLRSTDVGVATASQYMIEVLRKQLAPEMESNLSSIFL